MTGTTGTIKNAIFNFDGTLYNSFTHGGGDMLADDVFLEDTLLECEEWCKLYTKKWCFQAEVCPSTGRRHIQMRFSLKKKARKPPFLSFCSVNWSPTSNEINSANFFDYCTKNESCVDGTTKRSDDKIVYIPRQVRDIKEWRPWQNTILRSFDVFDKRHINWLYCPVGNIGKSTLATWCRCKGLARTIPLINDYRDLMGAVIDMKANAYILDMPRALKKDKQFQILGAIETIKDGYAFDTRYKYREENFDCPVIWVFSNKLPDQTHLSKDRWLIWTVVNNELQPYKPTCDIDDSDSEDDIDKKGGYECNINSLCRRGLDFEGTGV